MPSSALQSQIAATRCLLDTWDLALKAAVSGSDYSIDGISVTRQDVETIIQPNRRRLQREINQLVAADNGATAPSFRVANLQDPRM